MSSQMPGRSWFASRRKVATREAARLLHHDLERAWETRFGARNVHCLRAALQGLLDQRDGERARLSLGFQPHADGWRAARGYVERTNAVIDDPTGRLPHPDGAASRRVAGRQLTTSSRRQNRGGPPNSLVEPMMEAIGSTGAKIRSTQHRQTVLHPIRDSSAATRSVVTVLS